MRKKLPTLIIGIALLAATPALAQPPDYGVYRSYSYSYEGPAPPPPPVNRYELVPAPGTPSLDEACEAGPCEPPPATYAVPALPQPRVYYQPQPPPVTTYYYYYSYPAWGGVNIGLPFFGIHLF